MGSSCDRFDSMKSYKQIIFLIRMSMRFRCLRRDPVVHVEEDVVKSNIEKGLTSHFAARGIELKF